MGDALDLLFLREVGDALDQRGLVHLIGHVVENDRLASRAQRLDPRAGAHGDRAAAFQIGLADAGPAQDHAARREVGAGHDLHQPLGRKVGVLDQRQRGVDHLAQVVGRDVGGHADGDAARAVDQHVGETGGQDRRFAVLAVVVVLEIDGFLVDVHQQPVGGLGHPHLGIAHGRRGVAVHGPEVALPVQQRQRHGKVLRHPHQRVIDRRVAMRVVLTHHVAHGTGGLAIGLVEGVAGLVHREQDAAVDRLQPVAQVGDRAADDDRHGVIEIRGAHLGRDVDGGAVMGHHGAFRRLRAFGIVRRQVVFRGIGQGFRL